MASSVFVTGTDTGVGKTQVAAGLLRLLRRQGKSVVGYKPVASGCEATPEGLRNEDAVLLQAESAPSPRYELINPYAFAPPIAPHLAAARSGVVIDIAHLTACFHHLAGLAEHVVVEGAGGWLVPLSGAATMADLCAALKLPVILVVGIRLGCLNHALLTAEAIAARGLRLDGWVANRVDPACREADELIRDLCARLRAPLLGDVPWVPDNPLSATDVLSLPSCLS